MCEKPIIRITTQLYNIYIYIYMYIYIYIYSTSNCSFGSADDTSSALKPKVAGKVTLQNVHDPQFNWLVSLAFSQAELQAKI